ncbi:hydroxymethylglutaryl-CoA lyase [Bradyrhizobium sp. WSM3983]|uniref:hydroxymethylglutaryl-CoA lyase n=1 Tax=Bradyrhizobium sp. WSM3983 TaxID=1038867 RepID=UPI0003F988F3|nr:hydroxymethylglutaryl-CoA lyase [Bradyrhizobium sp. WSM3983]
MQAGVEIVEVGPRDGFQAITTIIPTDRKIELVQALYCAGVRRIEATSFVSPSALPQLADAAEIVRAANALDGLDAQVLVPTLRHAERALAAGAKHLAFVLSVSERHNRGNVRRSPEESAGQYAEIALLAPANVKLRVNVATAFDCPHDGFVRDDATLALLNRVAVASPRAEIALCDTSGRAGPAHVSRLFNAAMARFPEVERWAFHAHDTYGMAAANVLGAWNANVRVFDGAVAGLGGCPFAPGATGNVATEDLIWMFEGMDVGTGIDLDALVRVARDVTLLPGAQTGGRVRDALGARMRIRPGRPPAPI